MIGFWAIVKLTVRATVRSRVFLLLFGLLGLAIVLLPNTVAGDGTALAYIQVSLKYSLGAVSLILATSTLWLSCFTLAGDLESYQLHLITVKPISRVTVWLGKCVGVLLVHGVLLVLATALVYGFVQWQFQRRPFGPEERQRIAQEVLVGRRVCMPEAPDLERQIEEEYQRRVTASTLTGSPSTHLQLTLLREDIRRQVVARLGEVQYEQPRLWRFTGLRPRPDDPIYLRYRAYVGSIVVKEQRETVGHWAARIAVPDDPARPTGPSRQVMYPITEEPESIRCGAFAEMPLRAIIVGEQEDAVLGYLNLDPEKMSVFFQTADGPKLLVRVVGFEQNYLRAVLMIAVKLIFLAGLGCAAGGIFSAPVAIFVVAGYLMIGFGSSIVVGFDAPDPAKWQTVEGFNDLVGYVVSKAALAVISPVQRLEMTDRLAAGELIEPVLMARLCGEFLVLKGLPLFLLGIWYYRRRELGLAMRR